MIDQKQAEVAHLSLIWKSNEYICNALNLDSTFVASVLDNREVKKWMEEAQIDALSRDLDLSRLKWANDIIDRLIEWAKQITDAENGIDAKKWNRNHIELFKLLVTNLQKQEVKALNIIQNNFIQNNNSSPLSGFEERLSKLNSRQQAAFWDDLDELINKHVSHASAIEILP